MTEEGESLESGCDECSLNGSVIIYMKLTLRSQQGTLSAC